MLARDTYEAIRRQLTPLRNRELKAMQFSGARRLAELRKVASDVERWRSKQDTIARMWDEHRAEHQREINRTWPTPHVPSQPVPNQ